MVSCIRPLVLVRKAAGGFTSAHDRWCMYQWIRPQALIPVYKTVNTGIGSKLIGADTGASIYARPSGRGQDLDRWQGEHAAVKGGWYYRSVHAWNGVREYRGGKGRGGGFERCICMRQDEERGEGRGTRDLL